MTELPSRRGPSTDWIFQDVGTYQVILLRRRLHRHELKEYMPRSSFKRYLCDASLQNGGIVGKRGFAAKERHKLA